MQQILYHKPITWLACVGGAYANTLWTSPTAHGGAGVTFEAEHCNPSVRPANFYCKEKVPESPDVRLGSPLDPQSWPLNEGWVVPFDKVLLGSVSSTPHQVGGLLRKLGERAEIESWLQLCGLGQSNIIPRLFPSLSKRDNTSANLIGLWIN